LTYGFKTAKVLSYQSIEKESEMGNEIKSHAMPCRYCTRKKAKFFSAYGREGDGYTVTIIYISCEDCRPKLTRESYNGPVKILPLDPLIIDGQFKNSIDRRQMKEFIKSVLGQ